MNCLNRKNTCTRPLILILNWVRAGMTNLLMETDLSPQQLEYVKIAQASGNALV
jgi:hypothetical protein